MIPILFDSTETAFTSNGFGRLRDCISCIVTEERNGIYECDFEYPMDGANYDLIQVGRIIGVTHDDSDDIQPFDIVSFTKPIDGIVTFHAVHVSYRQSYLTATGSNINSLADAFTLFSTAEPSNPFSYWTDKTSTGYMGCADGTPRTVRQMLGGIEGSVLDAYGGEYEWDKWQVRLWAARGQYRDFSIRYGVNMLDYNEEYDSSNTYSSCIPYWTDGTTTVVGDKQTNGGMPPSGREQCIPLDVSEKFEDQPTKAQVEAMGLEVMNGQNPTIPSQNITVSFVRLQDMGEFADYQNLLQCKLCDTINVIFPDYNSSGTFKIVKTVWNVLTGKYDEMELGDLSISLSEALGINDIQRDSKTTIEQMQSDIAALTPTNHILWSGAWYMNASQTVPLSEKISEQINGIVLIWSAYQNGTAQNYDWIYTFIPKRHAIEAESNGKGVNTGVMATNNFSKIATKYVYVYDTSIVGHANNESTGTNNGVTRDNKYWVLRYVMGI